MSTTEQGRFELHAKLRSILGTKEADTLMEHLPPPEWTDFTRTADLVRATGELRSEMGELGAQLRAEMADLRTELKTEMAHLRTELKTEMADLRTELNTEMAHLRTELNTEMAHLHTELKTEMAHLRTELKTEMAHLRTEMRNEFGRQTWRYVGTTITLHAATIASVGYLITSLK